MQTFESGREASLLVDIKAGLKTIECRLNRGKFADYQVGDQVFLREDTYENGQIVASRPRQVLVEVSQIEQFPSFEQMLVSVGYEKVVPRATNLLTAVDECYKYYSPEDERQYGVLAIHFNLLSQGESVES